MEQALVQQYITRIDTAAGADAWAALDRELRQRPDRVSADVQQLLDRLERAAAPLMQQAMQRAMADGEGVLRAFHARHLERGGDPRQFSFGDAMADPDMNGFIRQVEAELALRDQYRGSATYEAFKARIAAAADDEVVAGIIDEAAESDVLADDEIERLSEIASDAITAKIGLKLQDLRAELPAERLHALNDALMGEDEDAKLRAMAEVQELLAGRDPGHFADRVVVGQGADDDVIDLEDEADALAEALGAPTVGPSLKDRLLAQIVKADGLAAAEADVPGISAAVEKLIAKAAEVAQRRRGQR